MVIQDQGWSYLHQKKEMFKSKTVTKDKDSHSIRRVNASWKWDSSQMHKGSTSGNIPRAKFEILWTDRHQYSNGRALPLRSIIINAEIKTEPEQYYTQNDSADKDRPLDSIKTHSLLKHTQDKLRASAQQS